MKRPVEKQVENVQVKKSFEYRKKKCLIVWVKTHYCAYVETIIKQQYHETGSLSPESIIQCHGGITFSGQLKQIPVEHSQNKTFFGIDFAHSNDHVDFGVLGYGCISCKLNPKQCRKWTLSQVVKQTKMLADGVINYEKHYSKIKEFVEEEEERREELLDEISSKTK